MIIWRGLLLYIVASASACISDERRVVVDVGGDTGDVAADSNTPDAEVTNEVEPTDTREDVTPDVPDTVDTSLIEETNEDTRPGDVADTEPADTAMDSAQNDTALEDTALDTGPADVIQETRIESDVADVIDALETISGDVEVPPECTEDNQCQGAIGVCEEWSCVAKACVKVDRVGPCDDGDVCTGAGTCSDGHCLPGPALTCESASPCARPTCDPIEGCGTEVVEGGFCEVPNGALWGTCSEMRMTPPDTCLVTGVCVDQSTSSATPLPKTSILGDWFIAIQSVLPAGMGTVAGRITFGSDGTWSGGDLVTNGAPVAASSLAPRGWCVDADGGLALDLSINHFVGQVDAAGEVFAASGKLGNEVMIGLRPQGTLASVDGTYAALLTTSEATWPVVWYGTLAFDHSCLAEGAVFAPQAGAAEPFFVVEQRVCLSLGADGRAQLDMPTETIDGAPGLLMLQGAIGARGEVLLFVREKSETSVHPGLLVLVRLNAGAGTTFQGRTSWVSPFQVRNAAVDGPDYRGFPGLLTFDGTSLVNGRFGGSHVVGERLVTDAYGGFVMDLRTPLERHTYWGHVSASRSFGMYYEVDAPESWDATTDVSADPAAPAFGVMVRRP